MKRVVVYPNNTVTINGNDADWSTEDLNKFGIKLDRSSAIRSVVEKGESFVSGDYHFTVYPNHVLSTGQLSSRLNYRGQVMRRKFGKDYYKKRGQNDTK